MSSHAGRRHYEILFRSSGRHVAGERIRSRVVTFGVIDRREEYERIGRERLAAEREVERDARRRLVRACLEVVAGCVLGMVIMSFAFRVTDVQLGEILLLAGMVVGYAAMAVALARAYLAARNAGDID